MTKPTVADSLPEDGTVRALVFNSRIEYFRQLQSHADCRERPRVLLDLATGGADDLRALVGSYDALVIDLSQSKAEELELRPVAEELYTAGHSVLGWLDPRPAESKKPMFLPVVWQRNRSAAFQIVCWVVETGSRDNRHSIPRLARDRCDRPN